MPHDPNSTNPIADLAVFGLGPGGLIAALEAAKNGQHVVAFTDRTSYIRSQRVYLIPETIKLLEQYCDPSSQQDRDFIDTAKGAPEVQIKDLERFLYRQLEEIAKTNTAVHIVHLSKGELPRFNNHPQHTEATLANGQSYAFRHLLAADGARHRIADQIRQDLNIPIQHDKTLIQPRHRYHAVVQLRLKSKQSPKTKQAYDPDRDMKVMIHAGHLNWDRHFLPNYYIFTNRDKTKFNFAGEIPEAIYRAPPDEQPNLLKAWASQFIQLEHGVDPNDLAFHLRTDPAKLDKNKLLTTTFEMENKKVNESTYQLPGGHLTFVGDARRTPVYALAHGLNHAIQGGFTFVQTLVLQHDKATYQAAIAEMDEEVDSGLDAAAKGGEYVHQGYHPRILARIDELVRLMETGGDANTVKALREARESFDQSNIRPLMAALELVTHSTKQYNPTFWKSQNTASKANGIILEIQDMMKPYVNSPRL